MKKNRDARDFIDAVRDIKNTMQITNTLILIMIVCLFVLQFMGGK